MADDAAEFTHSVQTETRDTSVCIRQTAGEEETCGAYERKSTAPKTTVWSRRNAARTPCAVYHMETRNVVGRGNRRTVCTQD